MLAYPTAKSERDAWVIDQRGARNKQDPLRPYGFFVEDECASDGTVLPVATVLLTNRECPWRCVMCDLWQNTLSSPTPVGAIPEQIRYALDHLPAARVVKLYNSGSFFDRAAIPFEDHREIASLLARFERVIVECHPALVGDSVLRFCDLIAGQLEIAMGLETAHPETLAKLNKGMTLATFAAAAETLNRHAIKMRAFILLQPPFLAPSEALDWADRSLRFAFDRGASAAVLIPTRAGNGAMDTLQKAGQFQPPGIRKLERALDNGLALARGRVFADAWDLHPTTHCCRTCFAARVARLRAANLSQRLQPVVQCPDCHHDPAF